MNWKNLRYFVVGIALCLISFAGKTTSKSVVMADGLSIPINLDRAEVEGGAAAPATLNLVEGDYEGKKTPGINLVMQHRVAYNSVRIPVDNVNGKQYNTLQFKVRFDTVSGDPTDFGVWILNKNADWAATSFLKFAKKLDNGWYQFSWDMVNQPDVHAIDMSALTQIQIRYGFGGVPEGKTDTLTVIDMNLVSGIGVKSGDPALYQKWEKYITEYKPDYSDSSKYLLPPETGRIATPLPLTKDGKAFSKIMVPAGASDPLKLAGTELQHWLKEISGADISIIAPPDNGNGTKVLLGRQFAVGKFDKDITSLGDTDGFAVRTRGKNIYIFGATDKGTLNGVYAFLENNTDIIWPCQLQEVSAVFSKNPTLNAVWADALEKPATRLRGWGTGVRDEANYWAARNRNNYSYPEGTVVKENVEQQQFFGNFVQFGGGHNISGWLGKDPAFYPVIEGKKVEVFNIWKHQPNFTAPGIADAVAKNMMQYIKDKAPSHINVINANIEDNWGVSTDPKSLEPIKLPDGSTIGPDDPAFRSTQFFIFLNDVTKKINAVYPDMMVGTYAYFFTADAPKVAVDPHILVMFCPYVRKDQRSPLYAPVNDHWWQQMKAWTKKTPNVVMREYIGILNGFRPIAEVEAADLRSYLPYGLRDYTSELAGDGAGMRGGSYSRGDDNWNFLDQEYWVINRLYWNPNQDVEQLRKYFIRRTYHEAAPEMEKFFGIIRSEYYKSLSPMGFVDAVPLMDQLVIKPGHEAELLQLLAKARAEVKNTTSRMLIDMLTDTFNRWTSQAKGEPQPDNAPFNVSPVTQLTYGWEYSNDWEASIPAWAADTVINRDDKTIPAVRMTLHPERGFNRDYAIFQGFAAGLLKAQSGDVLSFNMNPAEATSDPLQLVLTAKIKDGTQIQAPASAFTAAPNGGVKVQWTLQAEAGKPFDVTQIQELKLAIPHATITAKTPVVYYLTDFSLEYVAGAR